MSLNARGSKRSAFLSSATEDKRPHAAEYFFHLLKATTLTCCSLIMPSCCNIACLRPDIDRGDASRAAGSSTWHSLNVSRYDSTIVISVKSLELGVHVCGTSRLSTCDRNLQHSWKDHLIMLAFKAMRESRTPMEVL